MWDLTTLFRQLKQVTGKFLINAGGLYGEIKPRSSMPWAMYTFLWAALITHFFLKSISKLCAKKKNAILVNVIIIRLPLSQNFPLDVEG